MTPTRKPWLKKIAAMKEEVLAMAAKPQKVCQPQWEQEQRLYDEEVLAGKAHFEARQIARTKAGRVLGHADLNLRGWVLNLALAETEEDRAFLRWHLSISRTITVGAPFDMGDVRDFVDLLGGKYDTPHAVPKNYNLNALLWRWDHGRLDGSRTSVASVTGAAHLPADDDIQLGT